MDFLKINLADPGFFASHDPVPVWRFMREHAPVHWYPESEWPPFWSVFRYRDAVRIYRDATAFTSREGIMLTRGQLGPDPATDRMVIATDPPIHTELRRVMAQAIAPDRMKKVYEKMTRTALTLVAEAVEKGTPDFVADVSSRLPVSVICELLGVSERDWPLMYKLTSAASGANEPELPTALAHQSRAEAHSEILTYFSELIAARRRAPGDDILSCLAQAEIQGRPLSNEEILLNCDNLIIGGNEPARQAMSSGVVALAEHPAQWGRLRDDPTLIPPAVEEILRWATPVMHLMRTARSDVVISGTRIAAGDRILVWNFSANRDEQEFADPDRFDIRRTPNRHLAFGSGEHYCFGAVIARRQLAAFLNAFLRCVTDIQIKDVQYVRSNFIRGIKSMRVELAGNPRG
jgi:cytochrome P450